MVSQDIAEWYSSRIKATGNIWPLCFKNLHSKINVHWNQTISSSPISEVWHICKDIRASHNAWLSLIFALSIPWVTSSGLCFHFSISLTPKTFRLCVPFVQFLSLFRYSWNNSTDGVSRIYDYACSIFLDALKYHAIKFQPVQKQSRIILCYVANNRSILQPVLNGGASYNLIF